MALPAPGAKGAVNARQQMEDLYRSERDGLHAYLCGMLGPGASAEDAAQAAFEKAWRRRHLYRPSRGSRRAWLYTIARNTALDELRRRARQAQPGLEEAAADGPDEGGLPQLAQRRELLDAMRRLPARDREILALRYWADLPAGEIAALTGLSASNVTTCAHRALAQLRKELS